MLKSGKGIVLHRRKDREADTVMRVLLESGENVSVRLHGIRASKKRSQTLTEPGALVHITYYAKERFSSSLKEGEVADRYEEIKSGYGEVLLVSYLLELTNRAAQDVSPDLYRLLKGALDQLRQDRIPVQQSAESLYLFVSFYKVRLLKLLGLLGDAEHCALCGQELGEHASWAAPEMSFHCGDCSTKTLDDGYAARCIHVCSRMRFGNAFERLLADGAAEQRLAEFRRLDETLGKCLQYYYSSQSVAGPQLYRFLDTN